MHAPDAPARRRRRGEPTPRANHRAVRLAGRCAADRGALAALLAEDLLVMRATFTMGTDPETPAEIAARLLEAVLPRVVPAAAVDALAGDLLPAHQHGGTWSVTDVDVRLWFLAWSLGEPDHHAASRRT